MTHGYRISPTTWGEMQSAGVVQHSQHQAPFVAIEFAFIIPAAPENCRLISWFSCCMSSIWMRLPKRNELVSFWISPSGAPSAPAAMARPGQPGTLQHWHPPAPRKQRCALQLSPNLSTFTLDTLSQGCGITTCLAYRPPAWVLTDKCPSPAVEPKRAVQEHGESPSIHPWTESGIKTCIRLLTRHLS